MESQLAAQVTSSAYGEICRVTPAPGAPRVLIVCEHASNRIPEQLGTLGLDAAALQSHIAWDPGALAIAQGLAARLSGALVSAGISRLVYDCNRSPDAHSAIRAKSEVFHVPGNTGLSAEARAERAREVFEPFTATLRQAIRNDIETLRALITIHSFTPVFKGVPRNVEIGILHGQDDRLAKAMIATTQSAPPFRIELNAPYSAADGVAHTLDLHGTGHALLNVMIEIRNDLIETEAAQAAMIAALALWIEEALARAEGGAA